MVSDDHAHQSGSTVSQSFSVATVIHPIASARSMAVSGPPRRSTSRSEKSRQRVAVETATVCFTARAWSRRDRSRSSGSPDGSQDRDLSALPRIRVPEVLWCSRRRGLRLAPLILGSVDRTRTYRASRKDRLNAVSTLAAGAELGTEASHPRLIAARPIEASQIVRCRMPDRTPFFHSFRTVGQT